MNKIKELFAPRCIHRHTIESHPNCFREGKSISIAERNSSKVLTLDIETLPIIAYVWDTWNTNIYSKQIVKDWCILSWSGKWINDTKIMSDVLTSKEAINRDDKRLIGEFWQLLEDADVVIGQNCKRFDLKKLNTRFWKNGLHKPKSYKVIDTLSTAKSVFGLTYNNLDFIAKFIGAQEKLETEFELWAACDRGEKQALQQMREYNEQDVITQEEIYFEMREWIPNHPDLGVYENLENVCPVCLDNNYKEVGLYTSKSLQYKEYRCSNCNSIWHDTHSVKEKKYNGI